jgi:hypothetical protein
MNLALLLLAACTLTTRTYWTIDPAVFATSGTYHTHVAITGYVNYVACEDDADRHLRVVPSPGVTSPFFIAECIPSLPLPCASVSVGAHVTVKGISRRDPEHGWWEVHPVESIDVVQ